MEYRDCLASIISATGETNGDNISVVDGDLSNAIFYLQFGLWSGSAGAMQRCSRIIERHIELVGRDIKELRFGYGLSGFTWLMHALSNDGLYNGLDLSDFDEIDEYIFNSAEKYMQKGIFNYLDGGLGMGLYFLEKKESNRATAYLSEMVGQLERLAVRCADGGISWLDQYTSRYDNLPRKHRAYFNLGIPHGVVSIIYFLSKCYKAGIAGQACLQLMRQAISWIGRREDATYGSFVFPNKVLQGEEQYPLHLNNKFSWCNGAPGVALGFYMAGKVLEDEALIEKSLDIAQSGAAISLSQIKHHVVFEQGIYDIYICHGLAGIAHLYHKLYLVHKDASLKQASAYWLEQTLCYYEMYKGYNIKRTGILNGLPGIGLILLDQLMESSQPRFSWDSLLLTDIEHF